MMPPNERIKSKLILDMDDSLATRKLSRFNRALNAVARTARLSMGMTERGSGRVRDPTSGRFMRQPPSAIRAGARRGAGAFGVGLLGGSGASMLAAPTVGAARFGQGMFGQMGANLRDPSQSRFSPRNLTSSAMGGIGGILGLAGGVVAQGAGMAFSRAKQLADVNKQFGMARMSGFSGNLLRTGGAAMGMAPGEYAGQMASFARTRGMVGGAKAGLGMAPGELMRTGASLGALGQFAGLQGPGGGATFSPRAGVDALRQAVEQGVRGANLDKWLQAIAGYTQQVAQQGGRVNLGAVNRLTGRMQGTPGLKGMGALQPQFMAQGMGAVQGARQQVLGGLGGINQALAIQKASKLASKMQGGATPQNLARAFDQMMKDPNMAFGAFQGGLGELGFIGQGLSADVSKGLSHLGAAPAALKKGFGGRETPELPSGFGSAAAFARAESKMMGAGPSGDALRDMLQVQIDIQTATMKAGVAGAKIANEAAKTAKDIFDWLRGH